MIEPGFFDMTYGTLGEFIYIYKKDINISDEKKDSILTKSASLKIQEFLYRKLHGMPTDANNLYSDSRKFGHDLIDDNRQTKLIRKIDVQVGNKESYEEIIQVESDKNFEEWVDKEMVEKFKKEYETK